MQDIDTLPEDLVKQGTQSWVCGPHTVAGFSEGKGQGGVGL